MAHDTMTKNSSNPNQTMRSEQAKAEVRGSGSDRQREHGGMDKSRGEKSASGGGEHRSQTGEPGRARNELDQDKSRDFDKSRSEPAGQR